MESAASIFKPTLTGLIMKHFAHKFYIQSEHLKKYFPNAIFKGSLLTWQVLLMLEIVKITLQDSSVLLEKILKIFPSQFISNMVIQK